MYGFLVSARDLIQRLFSLGTCKEIQFDFECANFKAIFHKWNESSLAIGIFLPSKLPVLFVSEFDPGRVRDPTEVWRHGSLVVTESLVKGYGAVTRLLHVGVDCSEQYQLS